MTTDEIRQRTAGLLAGGAASGYTPAERAEIETLYRDIIGKSLRSCNCPDKYRDALIEISIYIKHHPTMEKPKYILKSGVVLHFGGDVYTNSNLTDDIAAKILAESPNFGGLFASVPGTSAEPENAVKSPENGENAELSARVAELESENKTLRAENESLKTTIAAVTLERDGEKAKAEAAYAELEKAVAEFNAARDSESAEKAPAPDEDNQDSSGNTAITGAAIRAAIAARVANGDTATAIVNDYLGIQYAGKALTKYGIEKIIKEIKSETTAE